MPDWMLVLPLVFPVVSALILAPVMPRLQPQTRYAVMLGWLVVEIALVLLNGALGTQRWVLSTWERAALTFALQMDGVTWLLVLTLLLLLLARWLSVPPRFDVCALVVLAAALLLATAEGVAMTLVAWTILDLLLFVWRWTRGVERAAAWRSLVLGGLMALVLLAGALTARTSAGAALLALALWARVGLFPFHALVPTRDADASERWWTRGIPLLAATNVWLHWDAFQAVMPYTMIGVLAGASLIVTALWTMRARETTSVLEFGAMYALAFVPLSLALGGEAGRALALWQTLAIALALVLGEIAQHWRAAQPNLISRALGVSVVCSLMGLPLTPAFLGRLGLYVTLVESGEWLLLALAFATTLRVGASLWQWMDTLPAEALRAPTRHESVGLLIALVAFVGFAGAAWLIAPALGIGEAAARALARVVWTNNVLGVAIGALVLVVPLVGAYFWRARSVARFDEHTFVARLARASELEWLERAATHVGWRISVLVRNVFALTEENPTVWILFAALWVAIFIAIAR